MKNNDRDSPNSRPPAAAGVAPIGGGVARRDSSPANASIQRSPRFPIRAQLLVPLALVALVGLTVVALSYGWLARRATTARIEGRLQGVVRALDQSSYPLTDAVLRQMADLSGATLLLADPRGRTLATSADTLSLDALTLAAAERSQWDDVTLGPAIDAPNGPYFHTAVGLHRRAGSAEAQTLHVLFPSRDYHSAWRAAIAPPLVAGGFMVVATALVVNSVAGRIGALLGGLGVSVGRLAEGQEPRPPRLRFNDETHDLADAVHRAGERMRQYEADLRRTERVRTVAMLGAGLAHEMRNAATGCRLAIDLHAEDCQHAGRDDCLDVARRQLRTVEGRLQQLLQLGREPSAQASEVVDLAALVDEAVDVVRPAARHNRVRIDWPGSDPHTVVACPSQLVQSIVNLLLNGVEAATRARLADADDAFVRVVLSGANGATELRVVDSGAGVDLPDGMDCFDPFVTQKAEGVGMGLWMCRTVVENAGGRIGWRREGDTTVFSVQMPTPGTATERASDG